MRCFTVALGAVIAGWALTGCRPDISDGTGPREISGPVTNYSARGVVQSISRDGKSVVVRHEAIGDYMTAMTMPFPVRDPVELQGLTNGAPITFRLRVTANDGWIDQIRYDTNPLTLSTNAGLPASGASWVSEKQPEVPIVPILRPGEVVPNYSFTNQMGQALDLKSLAGQVVVLDFIFTRCPFPDFCPRLSRRFANLQQRLQQVPPLVQGCHLLTVTFDPQFDTPERLASYGKTYGADPQIWSVCSASMDTIERLAGHFELYFAKDVEPAQQNHNLRTVVLDRQGRLVKVFKGNAWTADELAEAVRAVGAIQ